MTIRSKSLLGFALAACAFLVPARTEAAAILVFGQNPGQGNPFIGTNNGAGSTTLTATDIAITITSGENIPFLQQAFLTLSATSTNAASQPGGAGTDITQNFSGSFSITSAVAGGGTNFLSGTFTDAVFGSGSGLTLTASEFDDVVTFTSDVITTLGSPRSISLSLTNVNPDAAIVNGSLASFSATVSGNFSAEAPTAVPAPAALPLLLAGAPLLGLAGLRKWRKRA